MGLTILAERIGARLCYFAAVAQKKRIAIIPGDGIGKEVIPQAVKVLEASGANLETTHFDWGADRYLADGVTVPRDGFATLGRDFDAILLGAFGDPRVPTNIHAKEILLGMRFQMDLYANVRPVRLLDSTLCPLKGVEPKDVDFVVVRENTEGEYAQVGGFVYHDQPEEVAIQTGVFTRRGIERIVRFSFELAQRRNGKKRVTSVTKSNAQGFGMVLWDRTFLSVAAEFPHISTESLLVDAAAMNFIRRPESFDVVVGSNLFGDILSDISAIIIGSMGLAASANLDPLRRFPSMFEPVHGSAPDIAGKGVVNPLAAILSAAMMLDHLGAAEAAQQVERAVADVLAKGRVRTADLGGTSSTMEVTDAVLEKLRG